jgi:hypothetical protein
MTDLLSLMRNATQHRFTPYIAGVAFNPKSTAREI